MLTQTEITAPRVVLIDDEDLVRQMLRIQLDPVCDEIVDYPSAEAALKAEKDPAEVARSIWVIDLHYRSGSTGIDGLRSFQYSAAQPKAIVLSQDNSPSIVWAALHQGANVYLHKSDPNLSRNLPDAVQALAAGKSFQSDIMREVEQITNNPSVISELTPVQREVLGRLAAGDTQAEAAKALKKKPSDVSKAKGRIEKATGKTIEEAIDIYLTEGWAHGRIR